MSWQTASASLCASSSSSPRTRSVRTFNQRLDSVLGKEGVPRGAITGQNKVFFDISRHLRNFKSLSELYGPAGSGLLGDRLIREIVEMWMVTEFEGGRHQRRIDKIDTLGDSASKG